MNKLWLVAKEVYRKNVKSWTFFWMVVGPILMMAVIGAIVYFIGMDTAKSSVGNVAVITQQQEVKDAVSTMEDENTYIFDIDEKTAKEKLVNKEIDGYLLLTSPDQYQAKFYQNNAGKSINTTGLGQVLSQLSLESTMKRLNLDAEALAAVEQSRVNIETIRVQQDDKGNTTEVASNDPVRTAKIGLAYVVCIVVFTFTMNYVGIVSQEIAAEKGSRIMEIVLSSVSATSHFLGKMLGVSMVIVTQMLIYLGLGFVLTQAFKVYGGQLLASTPISSEMISTTLKSAGPLIGYGALFAVLGISVYAVIAAFLGSLVSKVEDVNKMIAPITFIGLAGFYIALYALNSPNSGIVKFGSLFPLFSAFVMPFRLANDVVTGTDILLAVAFVIIFLVICVWLSVVFYKSNVLVYSDKGLTGAIKESFAILKNERKEEK